jgi:alpha-tubulin suppressor-like RCC1 family protein
MGARLFICVIIAPILAAGCGLFGELPEFQGSDTGLSEDASGPDAFEEDVFVGECTQVSDCEAPQNMEARCEQNECVFECEAGFVDRDDPIGCECEIGEEVCDGVDNDCDGAVDNIFAGGQIEVGRSHTCATTADGEIYCWGNNPSGQLGLGTTALQTSPKRLPASGDLEAEALSAGADHTCVIDDTSSQIYCWGAGTDGQLGSTESGDKLVPTAIGSTDPFVEVAAGESHTCANDENGQTLCWGSNAAGQLGTGDKDPKSTPTPIADSRTFVALAAGSTHTCALMDSGSAQGPAYCWGSNADAQLGAGDTAIAEELTPASVDSSRVFVDVAVGQTSSCARTPGNEIFCWGDDDISPVRLTHPGNGDDVNFRVLSVGARSICGVLADDSGNVLCSGTEGWSEITELELVDVATAFDHTCAISGDGRVYCWGDNAYGQVGNGSTGGTVVNPASVACK